jgi:Zn-dependent protease with chaperone function
VDFDFQRYIQERTRASGGGEGGQGPGLHYAYEADKRAMRTLDRIKPVKMALELSGRLGEGDVTEIFGQVPVVEASWEDKLHRALAQACRWLQAEAPRVRVVSAVKGGATALEVAGQPVILLDVGVLEGASVEQLSFLLGAQVGHVVHGHSAYLGALLAVRRRREAFLGWAARPAEAALERWESAGGVTADRAGLIACGDLKVAAETLIRAARGWEAGSWQTLEQAMEEGWEEDPPEDGALHELAKQGPSLPGRLRALQAFSEAEAYREAHGLSGGELLSTVDRRVSRLIKRG